MFTQKKNFMYTIGFWVTIFKEGTSKVYDVSVWSRGSITLTLYLQPTLAINIFHLSSAISAEVVVEKPPEHKITVKEIATFVLQDAENIVKNSKW